MKFSGSFSSSEASVSLIMYSSSKVQIEVYLLSALKKKMSFVFTNRTSSPILIWILESLSCLFVSSFKREVILLS